MFLYLKEKINVSQSRCFQFFWSLDSLTSLGIIADSQQLIIYVTYIMNREIKTDDS
jgi:hypothetical protein